MHPKQPNHAQRAWRESIRLLGMGNLIHHCTDREMKIKGVGNIGHWFIIPLADEAHHDIVHKELGHDRKPYEKARFKLVCAAWEDRYREPLPLPEGVYKEILAFHK